MKECTSSLNLVSRSNLANSEKVATLSDSGLCREIITAVGPLALCEKGRGNKRPSEGSETASEATHIQETRYHLKRWFHLNRKHAVWGYWILEGHRWFIPFIDYSRGVILMHMSVKFSRLCAEEFGRGNYLKGRRGV